MDPLATYNQRLDHWRRIRLLEEKRFRAIGNARLGAGIAGVVIAWAAFGASAMSPAWLLAPVAGFIVLATWHDRVVRRGGLARRAIQHYERGLARIEGQWPGTGNSGDRFRDPQHVYADDLDLFGKGSLFELLDSARTATGEATLARWLLAPSAMDLVRERQNAIKELKLRVDLREDVALLGEEVRAGVHAESLARWGSAPAVKFFPGARIAGLVLGLATTASLIAFFFQAVPPNLILVLVLLEIIFSLAVRRPVQQILGRVAAPARELALLAALLERLERETFESPRLQALEAALRTTGHPASRRIAGLEQRIDCLDWARNVFFRIIAIPLLWIPQWAMAIEAWRRKSGPGIGGWMETIGEFEALGSLAAYAFEQPSVVFPELAETGPQFIAEGLRHPLIAQGVCVPNDVSLGGDRRLLVVSGSNMSGKSTLLRAVGLNAVLAWAGAPVTAARLIISPLAVGASMRAIDSVQDGRSRFYAEITRLRQISDLLNGTSPVLFLLDELLSGTNSHDRRIGAEAVVRSLVDRGGIGLVTTHDLALAAIADSLAPRASNVHFEDQIEDGEIRFDYRMRPGVVTRSNALALMRAVGFHV